MVEAGDEGCGGGVWEDEWLGEEGCEEGLVVGEEGEVGAGCEVEVLGAG